MTELLLDLDLNNVQNDVSEIRDKSPKSRHGKINGSSFQSEERADGFFRKSLFLQKNSYIEIPNTLEFKLSNGLTFSLWLYFEEYTRPDVNQGMSYNPDVLGNFFEFSGSVQDSSSELMQLSLRLYYNPDDSGFFVFRVDDPHGKLQPIGDEGRSVSIQSKEMPRNTWVHLAAVIEFSKEQNDKVQLRLFINNKLQSKADEIVPRSLTSLRLTNNKIGGGVEWNVAHFCLYNKALSQEEIRKVLLTSLILEEDPKILADILGSLDNKTLATVLGSLDRSKFTDKALADALEKMREEILATQKDRTWESLKVLFDLKKR